MQRLSRRQMGDAPWRSRQRPARPRCRTSRPAPTSWRVLPSTAEVKDGHLWIGGVDTVELAARGGHRALRHGRGDDPPPALRVREVDALPLEGRRRRLRRQGVHVARDGQARRRGGLLPRRLERRRARLRAARRASRWSASTCTATTRRPSSSPSASTPASAASSSTASRRWSASRRWRASAASRRRCCSASRRASRPTRTTSS